MKQRNKIIAFILAFAIAFSIVGAVAPMEAYAATGSVLTDTASVSAWNTYFEQNYILGSVTEIEGVSVSLSSVKAIYWGNFNATFSDIGLGSMPTYDRQKESAPVIENRGINPVRTLVLCRESLLTGGCSFAILLSVCQNSS